jgi:hypothetical protein
LIAAGGVFLFLKTVPVLSVKNLDHPGTLHVKVTPSEQVILFYTHSMYTAPVEEVFELREGEIILKAVRTASPAVLEYYGFEGTESVQSLDRSLGPAFSIHASMRQDQGLRIGRRILDMRAFAGAGDRVQVSVDQVSLARFLGWKMFREDRTNPSTRH